jgi:hypothetical protein
MHTLNSISLIKIKKYDSWKSVKWASVQQRVSKWQEKIFKASKENNSPKVRLLQKRLVASMDAKLLAVRRAFACGARSP